MTSAQSADLEYSGIAKGLHWAIAALVIVQVVLAKMAEESASEVRELALLVNHRSVGITILALALVRLAWRFLRPPPAPVPMPAWQRTASQVAHWGLYALLFVVPLSGWLMSSADGVAVQWFGLVSMPDLLGANEGLEDLFEEIHEVCAKVLVVLAILHAAAGLKHGFVDKDASLRRISSPLSIGSFVVILALGVALLI